MDTTSSIKLSSELFFCTEEDNKNIYLVDPKNLTLIETYGAESLIGKEKLLVSEKYGYLIAEQSDKTILAHFTLSNNKVHSRISLPEKLTSFCLSPDELFLYAGGQSGIIYIWDYITGQLLHKIQAHHKPVTKLVITDDGGVLISAGEDFTINTWFTGQIFCKNSQWSRESHSVSLGDLLKIKPKHSMIGHSNFITGLCLTQQSEGYLASVSTDKTCRIWDYCKGVLIMMLSLESPINCITMDPFGDVVYLGCKNHNIYAHKITESKEIYQIMNQDLKSQSKFQVDKKNINKKAFTGHKAEIYSIHFYVEENLIVSGSSDGQVLFWNTEGSIVKQYNMLTKPITNLLFFKRTREFEKNDTFLKNRKKGVEYKPLKKFEDDKPFSDPIVFPIKPIDKSVNGKRKSETHEDSVDLKKYVRICAPFIDSGNHHYSQSGKQSDVNQEMLAELKKDNERLIKMNEKLFGLCFMKEKH